MRRPLPDRGAELEVSRVAPLFFSKAVGPSWRKPRVLVCAVSWREPRKRSVRGGGRGELKRVRLPVCSKATSIFIIAIATTVLITRAAGGGGRGGGDVYPPGATACHAQGS